MKQAEIGVIGLGVMGSNIALNIAEKGYLVSVYNREPEWVDSFMQKAGNLSERIIATKTLEDLVSSIRPPRPILIMITAGSPVDMIIDELTPLLSKGDILIDGGNTNFRDTQVRCTRLTHKCISFIGMGVSGGKEGARHGPSLMVGATPEAYDCIKKILTSISANYNGEPCCALLGPDGAGHFVKTIHNGIEYADMQMIAEIYGILRDKVGKSTSEISDIFYRWKSGRLNSYLIEVTAEILSTKDQLTGNPIVDIIVDKANQKGTGKWFIIESQELAVPVTTIEAAVTARNISCYKIDREQMEALFGQKNSDSFEESSDLIKDLELALYASKIIAYTQGFSMLAKASDTYSWKLKMESIACIWRAGCIIRSQLLDDISEAFMNIDSYHKNLLQTPIFSKK